MLAGSPRVDAAWLRYPSYAVDTMLLTIALILTSIIHQYPFADGWLTMKVALLCVYVLLGSVALKRGRTRRITCRGVRRGPAHRRLPVQRGACAPSTGNTRDVAVVTPPGRTRLPVSKLLQHASPACCTLEFG